MSCDLMSRFRRTVRRFARADRGNIAMLFALTLVPLLCFVGAAIDYSRAARARSSMQAALDSTALMLAKDLSSGILTNSQIDTTAQNYFNALYTDKEVSGVSVTSSYTTAQSSSGSTIQVNASGQIMTDFMKLAGIPTMSFSANSTSAWGTARLRVSMVLDNTGSMAQDGKMTALHNAAAGSGGLIDQLSNLAQNPGDVYISIIPFAKGVNVDASNYTQSWIDWTDWLNPPTTQPNNGTKEATLPLNWHAVGPTAKCPFTNSIGHTNGAANGGFVCKSSPTASDSSTVSTIQSTTISINGASVQNPICPTTDGYSHTKYNGCWESKPTGLTEIFCSGSGNCSCPKNSSGSNVSGCSCTGSGASKSCTGNTYDHNWTQPGPNDLTDNPGQPRVSAAVGFKDTTHTPNTDHIWTPTATTVANDWRQPSTNPISTWTGCVVDRTQPNDANTMVPSSDVTTKYPANQYYENNTAYCSNSSSPQLTPVIPLSSTWSTLKTAVNNMQPTGSTNQAVALSIGMQTLTQGGPFTVPTEDPNYIYNRIIILLSDGLNTEDRWPDYGDGTQQFNGSIDARQAQLCSNIKAQTDPKTGKPMYTIYTIQVNTSSPADPTSTVLQNCASTPDKFFMLTSSTEIVSAFNTIGTQLSRLRVAK